MSPTIFEDKAPNVAAAIIILVAISAVVFPLRIYTRVKHKAFGWDDFTMCCAAVSSSTLTFFLWSLSFRSRWKFFVYLLLSGLGLIFWNAKQVPFGALSVFCLGAAFLGVGVHKWNLDEEKSERAMMVCHLSLTLPTDHH